MQLIDWQTQFQNTVVLGGPLWEPTNPAKINQAKINDQRIKIYQNAYVQRLTLALRENYTVTHLAMGDEEFNSLATRYIEMQPSVRPSIRWFGSHLSRFLMDQLPWSRSPWLSELANLEWALRHSQDAEDLQNWTMDELKNKTPDDWEEEGFFLHPSVTLMEFKWNSPQLWKKISTNDLELKVSPQRLVQKVVVWRSVELACQWKCLSTLEFELIKALGRSHNFFESFKRVKRKTKLKMDDWNSWAAMCLSTWVQDGLLVKKDQDI